MLTPEIIRRRAELKYADYLSSLMDGVSMFPLKLPGAKFTKVSDFAADRAWIDSLRSGSKEQAGGGYEIEWAEREFRRFGTQRVPEAVWLRTEADYLALIGKRAEVDRFRRDADQIVTRCPELKGWVKRRPMKVVENEGRWTGLLDVCCSLRDNPRPGCYVRELPVLTDTKFVEDNSALLNEILPLAAPATVVEGETRFERRFGFRHKQPMLRMRLLDPAASGRWPFPVADLSVPLDDAATIVPPVASALVVENEMTFLTLPRLAGTLALYGAGNAAALLGDVPWLRGCRVYYWGDLDTHGFEILANLRAKIPQVVSVLMDERTYQRNLKYAVKASASRATRLLHLTPSEQALYDRLRESQSLLEQERLPLAYVRPALSEAIEGRSGLLGREDGRISEG